MNSHTIGQRQKQGQGRRLLRMLSLVAVIGMLLVMLAACGEDDATDDGDTTPTTGQNTGGTPTTGTGTDTSGTPTDPAGTPTEGSSPDTGTPGSDVDGDDITHPVGGRDVIIRIEDVGGFVPQEFLLTRLPSFVLYGDGCFIVQGAQIEIYPQPLLPPLMETCLTEEGIQQVLQQAQAAGLLDGDAEYTNDTIADASTTVFTVNAGDVTSVVSVYALGIDPEQNPNLTPEENEAREALSTFLNEMLSLSTTLPTEMIAEAEHLYESDGMRLIWADADDVQQNDEGLERQEIDWPLDTDLVTLGETYWQEQYRCAVVTGEDLETLMPLLESANQLTLWNSGDNAYVMFARPQLPDENGCQEPVVQ